MRPKSVVLQSREKLQVLEKKFFLKKKNLPASRYDLQNRARKLVSRYLNFFNFKVLKNCSSQ